MEVGFTGCSANLKVSTSRVCFWHRNIEIKANKQIPLKKKKTAAESQSCCEDFQRETMGREGRGSLRRSQLKKWPVCCRPVCRHQRQREARSLGGLLAGPLVTFSPGTDVMSLGSTGNSQLWLISCITGTLDHWDAAFRKLLSWWIAF